ncbi:hypothetical protein QFZ30_002124 [Arthrobacter pascens]|nr:hypothetical protein [Arthrobacter pascens]
MCTPFFCPFRCPIRRLGRPDGLDYTDCLIQHQSPTLSSRTSHGGLSATTTTSQNGDRSKANQEELAEARPNETSIIGIRKRLGSGFFDSLQSGPPSDQLKATNRSMDYRAFLGTAFETEVGDPFLIKSDHSSKTP